MSLNGPHGQEVRLAVVAEAFVDWTLPELLDWLTEAAPHVDAVELGSGGYAPHPHCDRRRLLSDPEARRGLAGRNRPAWIYGCRAERVGQSAAS